MESKNFDDWDMKQAEWRGYVVRALEDTNSELKGIKESIQSCEDKIDSFNDRLTGIQIKVAAIGGTTGLIISLLFYVITGM